MLGSLFRSDRSVRSRPALRPRRHGDRRAVTLAEFLGSWGLLGLCSFGRLTFQSDGATCEQRNPDKIADTTPIALVKSIAPDRDAALVPPTLVRDCKLQGGPSSALAGSVRLVALRQSQLTEALGPL